MRNENSRPPEVPTLVPPPYGPVLQSQSQLGLHKGQKSWFTDTVALIFLVYVIHLVIVSSLGTASYLCHNFIIMELQNKQDRSKLPKPEEFMVLLLAHQWSSVGLPWHVPGVLPRSRCQRSRKDYGSSQVHRLRRMKKGQAVSCLPPLQNRSFTTVGKALPSCITASRVCPNHTSCSWCSGNNSVCHWRV